MDSKSQLSATRSGRVAVRPTWLGTALIGATLTVGILTIKNELKVASITTLLFFSIADTWFSTAQLRKTTVVINPLQTWAQNPEQITFLATASGISPVTIRLDPLDKSDPAPIATVTSSQNPVICKQQQGVSRHKLFASYSCAISTFGLIAAHQTHIMRVPLFRAPGPHQNVDFTPPAMAKISDFERLRKYEPGDQPSKVHWPTYARTGQLMIRHETPVDDQLVVILDFSTTTNTADKKGQTKIEWGLSYAARLCSEAIDNKRALRLISAEHSEQFYEQELFEAARRIDRTLQTPKASLTKDICNKLVIVDRPVTSHCSLVQRLAAATAGAVHTVADPPFVRITTTSVQLVTGEEHTQCYPAER